MKKTQKETLPNYPEPDSTGKLGEEWRRLKGDMRELKKKIAEKEKEVIGALEATGREKLRVDGCTLRIKRTPEKVTLVVEGEKDED